LLPFTEGFIPHVTISEFGCGSTEEAEGLAKTLNKGKNKGTFLCKKISYVKPDEEFNFETKRTLKLKK